MKHLKLYEEFSITKEDVVNYILSISWTSENDEYIRGWKSDANIMITNKLRYEFIETVIVDTAINDWDYDLVELYHAIQDLYELGYASSGGFIYFELESGLVSSKVKDLMNNDIYKDRVLELGLNPSKISVEYGCFKFESHPDQFCSINELISWLSLTGIDWEPEEDA